MKNKLRKGIILAYKIHMVETLDRGTKSGVEKKLGEGEGVSLNTLSFRKTKIWQDYSTLIELKRGENRGFFVSWNGEEGVLYSSGGENMNGRSFNEGWQRIKKNHEPRPYFKLWGNLVH